MSKLVKFTATLAVCFIALELLFRACEPLLFASSHRVLFKAALLERRTEVNVVFVGSSRTERGVLPAIFDAKVPGSRSFNMAVNGTSFDVLSAELGRIAKRPSVKLVMIELAYPVTGRGPLEWERAAEGPIASRSTLVRLRSALRHDSLARLGAALFFGPSFDGSESLGSEFVHSVLRGHVATCASPCVNVMPVPSPVVAARAMHGYTDLAAALEERIKQLPRAVFLVPPLKPMDAVERTADFRRFMADVSARTGAPVYDFAALDTAATEYMDTQHLTGSGSEAYTDALARIANGAALALH
jgi:hypothetical protein